MNPYEFFVCESCGKVYLMGTHFYCNVGKKAAKRNTSKTAK